MSLAGLVNDNEFYSEHYLAEVFVKDIDETVARWRTRAEAVRAEGAGGQTTDGFRPPDAALNALRQTLPDVLDALARQRDLTARVTLQRDWTRQLADALELPWAPRARDIDDELTLPLLAELVDGRGKPLLWLLEAVPNDAPDADPLTLEVHPAQLSDAGEIPLPEAMRGEGWQSLLAGAVFVRDDAPRWIVLAGLHEWLLLDRTKFGQGRLLRFDWVEILRRHESETLRAVAALLHRDAFVVDPNGATQSSLHEALEEKAHKHAYGVSEDLKYALRESIELLGNEAARQLVDEARAAKKGIFVRGKELEKALTEECLRYMYRLLFLFYIEARPELGYAPIDDDTYLRGYSLEHLRELEMVELDGERERGGRYLHDSIAGLFRLIDQGFKPPVQRDMDIDMDAFRIAPLKSHLFDPKRTALLERVVFPNHVLQQVVRLMSLTRPGRKRRRRGRVSYAQLGINQLGAVYEALLSFRGFFAAEELFEVKRKGDTPNDLETGYFVTADALVRYDEEEKVYVKNARGERELKRHPKGSFIYRMAGRDRQQSASYYTPEVLTACLVKYALKELFAQQIDSLPDAEAKARRILSLTVCEPAMGSAAFLNEAVNQLADRYLEFAQEAKGERIPQSRYAAEKQRVKMYLADHAVFGIDLNPVAVELAEVSLWLNALSKAEAGEEAPFVPWFGLQLHCGNSLVGARRETYPTTALARAGAKDVDSWLNTAPDALPMAEPLPEKRVWHFLLPDRGMAKYDDKAIKERYPDEIKAIKAWNKSFTAPFDADEIGRLTDLSERVDALWQEHATALADLRRRTTDAYDVYGFDDRRTGRTTLAFKNSAHDGELLAKGLSNTNAYQRLRLVMNYWCALWFWPIDAHAELPSREEWLFDLEALLLGDTVGSGPAHESGELFPPTQDPEVARAFVDRNGVVDPDRLFRLSPRYALAERIAEQHRFFHWEVAFADLFHERGGFDLIVGNPPWLQISWKESEVFGDEDPRIVFDGASANEVQGARSSLLRENHMLERVWRNKYVGTAALGEYLGAASNFPLLSGAKVNLYRCFLSRAFSLISADGLTGFVHESGLFSDSDRAPLRAVGYGRLRLTVRFPRAMHLFGIPSNKKTAFEVGIYGSSKNDADFMLVSSVSDPKEVDYALREFGQVAELSEEAQKWRKEAVRIRKDELSVFSRLYDDSAVPPLLATLPSISSRSLVEVARAFVSYPKKLKDVGGGTETSEMWHQTGSVRSGILQEQDAFPEDASEWIFCGPQIYLANPFYKGFKRNPKNSKALEVVDLGMIEERFFPRSRYVYDDRLAKGLRPVKSVCWLDSCERVEKKLTSYYRVVNREMIDPLADRSFVSAIIPPEAAHIHTVFGRAFERIDSLLDYYSFSLSIIVDYLVKARGAKHVNASITEELPVNACPSFASSLWSRALGLSCLSRDYSKLWSEAFLDSYKNENWSVRRKDLREYFSALSGSWNHAVAIRVPSCRRQALLEIDVLVAIAMGVTLDALLDVYRSQFSVLRNNESETYYDQNGEVVFTRNTGLPGVGMPRKAGGGVHSVGVSYGVCDESLHRTGIALGWEDVRDMTSGTVTKTFMDDTMPGGPHRRTIEYVAPFFRPDREEDYRVAWAFFEERLKADGVDDAASVA